MRWLTACAVALGFAAASCIQMPTEKQEVSDLRPQFSFKLADPSDDAGRYRVFVDDLDMGSAASYVAGRNGLRVLSGTHVLRVEGGGRVVLQERVYLGDGAIRTILIPQP